MGMAIIAIMEFPLQWDQQPCRCVHEKIKNEIKKSENLFEPARSTRDFRNEIRPHRKEKFIFTTCSVVDRLWTDEVAEERYPVW